MPKSNMTWEQAVAWLKTQPGEENLVRACFFDDPLAEAARRYYEGTEWRAVRSLLPKPSGLALDVGAGRGISSYALARDGWQVVALEPDPSATVGAEAIRSLAAGAGLPIKVEQTWGEQLPFPDNSFRVVHCRQVLHHARDLKQLGRELGRVLSPGGCFIATREHVLDRREDLQRFLDAHSLHKFYGGENAYMLKEYLAALKGGGITIERLLNPFESDINLFPGTQADLRRAIAKRVYFPWPALIPKFVLAFLGSRNKQPGRLYSFLGTKR